MTERTYFEAGSEVFVACLMPYEDGSGTPIVLGVYSTDVGAQARCWRARARLGYDQPTAVTVHRLDDEPSNEDEPELNA
jgi:hypothetical protein